MANVLHFCLPQFVNGRRNNKIWYHWIRAHWGSTCAYDSNQSRCRTRCCCRYKNVEDLAMQNFQVPLYESVEEMLMPHSNIQVVCIATPNGYHCQHAIQALSMGCHVVVEKPMALSVDDCDAIIQEAQKRNKRIFCVMQNRFSPHLNGSNRSLTIKSLERFFKCKWFAIGTGTIATTKRDIGTERRI